MKVYSTEEVADILKIHKRTVLNEINRGNLRAKRIGNKFRITDQALQEYLKPGLPPKEADKKAENGPEEPSEVDSYITTQEASKRLDKSLRTVQRYVKQGKLEGYKDGKNWRISKESVEKMRG